MTSRLWGNVEKVENDDNNVVVDGYRLFMKNDGTFPNNNDHPLLLYRNSFNGSQQEAESLIVGAGWTSPWVWGVFEFHHYHSTAWELLLCVRGSARIQLGGPQGPTVEVEKGDTMLVPPGFAHKQLSEKDGFALLGAYPEPGIHVDTLRGAPTQQQLQNIEQCHVPETDPILGIPLASMYNTN